jgi:predicted  nucleic acid-binding Zn-ribbon protein
LYQLQSLDSELDKARKQLADIAANLGESNALKTAKTALVSAEQTLQTAKAKMQDLDLEVKSLVQKITQEEKILYGGSKAISAKEAANLQEEVASLKRRQSNREEALLEAMVEMEEAEDALKQAQDNLANVQAGWKTDQADLVEKQGMLEKKVAELLEQRPTVLAGVDAEALEEYDDIRPKKAGVAVSMVKDGMCRGCGMAPSQNKLRQARSGDELIFCGGCGRILYVP